MRRVGSFTALLMLLTAVSASVALAVDPGIFTPTADSFDTANAPGSSNLKSGSPSCTVNADRSIDCSAYVLAGVGHTDAELDLIANYSATIDCTNKGGNLVESHTSSFSASRSATLTAAKNGQLSVRAQSVSPFTAPQVCPNPNWTPSIRGGVVQLSSFTYTLNFDGFPAPYIEISAP